MKVAIVILKLLFLGALFIISNHELGLNEPIARNTFIDLYSSWLSHIYNQGFQVTSYVVKFEWLPDLNQTYLKK